MNTDDVNGSRMILLIAPNGMLGRAWRELLETTGDAFETANRDRIDLAGENFAAISSRHALVINCAAYTDVDGAESNENPATDVNGRGVGALAEQCKQTRSLLVHYSTDYVFSGRATRPYPVGAPIEPINAYGRSKALGEELIRQSGCRHLICRTSWLYAPWGKNFVRTIAGLAAERDELSIVHDQRGRPTSCRNLARQTLTLIGKGATGTFHITDGGECSWYEFARDIVRITGARCRVQPCTTADFPRPAPRPAYSLLDLTETETLIGPATHWTNLLEEVIGEMAINRNDRSKAMPYNARSDLRRRK